MRKNLSALGGILSACAVALVLLTLLAACGGDGPDDAASPTPRPTSPAVGSSSPQATTDPSAATPQATADGGAATPQATPAPGSETPQATGQPEPSPTPEGVLSRVGVGPTLAPDDTPEPTRDAPPVPQASEEDREALVAFYNATGGDNWDYGDASDWPDNLSPWLEDAPLDEWYGVNTDSNGRVTRIYLRNLGLTGEIPSEVQDLEYLESLALASNQLSGQIPAELGNLDNLMELDLSHNHLHGQIPAELGNLGNLEELELENNNLSGQIPPELGRLENLDRLYLWNNQLTGQIPSELGNLGALVQLGILRGNSLTGCVPDLVDELLRDTWRFPWFGLRSETEFPANITVCDVPGHQGDRAALMALYSALSGENWSEGARANWQSDAPLGEWAGVSTDGNGRVVKLDISGEFTGQWPPEMWQLSNLKSLDINGNLSGNIPAELSRLEELRILGLGYNKLTGAIPPELGNLQFLSDLNLSNNELSGEIPSALADLEDLKELRLGGNDLRQRFER